MTIREAIEFLESQRVYANNHLADLQKALKGPRPWNALEWSLGDFEAAGFLKASEPGLASLKNLDPEDDVPDRLVQHYINATMNSAHDPRCSTSATANLMGQKVGEAYAKIAQRLSGNAL